MNKNLSVWQLGGFTFAVALGTILHFILGWTGFAIFAPIAAVNESTFEHMKILFFPMLVFAFIERRYVKADGYWWIKLIGTLAGILSIPVLFYTFSGAFGKTPDWLNVLFFFIAAGGAYLLEWGLFKIGFAPQLPYLALGSLLAVGASFVFLTFLPPKLPLFLDPIAGGYGIA